MDPQDGEQEYYPNYEKCDEADDISVSSNDSLHEFIRFQSHVNTDGLEESITFTYPETHRTITLSTQLSENDLAPIFDGSSWAGTRLWSASIFGIKYLVDMQYEGGIKGKTLCELGAGLGLPGIVWHMMGGTVVITEHERIMSQLDANIAINFPHTFRRTIQTTPLNWSREAFQQLLQDHRRAEDGFDVILNCDCIFEPLYGRSWIKLADVIDESLKINPKCLVVTSVERRAQDGIDQFLEYLTHLDHVTKVDLVAVDVKVHRRLEIYITRGRCE
jgi:predicted nicotinamide N-methyase